MFSCDQCFDTQTIDQGGREIACPSCVPIYRPSSVTIRQHETGRYVGLWQAWDTSWKVEGCWYGIAGTEAEARKYMRRRQGVIRAALTRRSNKKNAK